MNNTAQIFLCYAKEDKPQVEELYDKLKQAGFAPWMDKVDLIGGEEWRPTIQNAIKQAHFFVACVSRHWVPTNPEDRRRFFRREIQTALDVLPELPPGDIFIIPIRLEECEVPESLTLFHWIDYFQQDGWERLLKAIHTQSIRLGLRKPLRSQPAVLSKAQVSLMLLESDFFDTYMNPGGKGTVHQYERRGETIFDKSTGLTWQQSGSGHTVYVTGADFLQRLNHEKFGGYDDWRLPTLEEAMSLMERDRTDGGLYIDPVFDQQHYWIWTADKHTSGSPWGLNFEHGYTSYDRLGALYDSFRAVRAGQS